MNRYYESVILGEPFIYRPITRKEYGGFVGINAYEAETAICRIAVVDPLDVDWNNIRAGIPSTLAACIKRVSGMGDGDYLHTMIKSEIDRVSITPELWMDSIIQYIYPQYTDEYLLDLTVEQTATLYAKALYANKFLEGEKIVIGLNKMEDIKKEQAKNAPLPPPPLLKPGRNIYSQQGVM